MSGKKEICPPSVVQQTIDVMALAIIDDFKKQKEFDFALVGIHKEGVPLAQRLIDSIERQCGYRPQLGTLDVSMYRDDFGLHSALPLIRETNIPFDMDEQNIILVDDVLSSGRTIRAALDALTDYGRPSLIRLAVLLDRKNTEYPIYADYAGITQTFPADKKVVVELAPEDDSDGIYEIYWQKKSNPDV